MSEMNFPQHTIYRMANAEYLGKRIYNVISNYFECEEEVTYAQFETRELAEQWMKDTWGEDQAHAHVATSLIVTLRIAK